MVNKTKNYTKNKKDLFLFMANLRGDKKTSPVFPQGLSLNFLVLVIV